MYKNTYLISIFCLCCTVYNEGSNRLTPSDIGHGLLSRYQEEDKIQKVNKFHKKLELYTERFENVVKAVNHFRAVNIATHDSSQKGKAINALSLLFKARTELDSTFDNISSYIDKNDNSTMRMISPSFRETDYTMDMVLIRNITSYYVRKLNSLKSQIEDSQYNQFLEQTTAFIDHIKKYKSLKNLRVPSSIAMEIIKSNFLNKIRIEELSQRLVTANQNDDYIAALIQQFRVIEKAENFDKMKTAILGFKQILKEGINGREINKINNIINRAILFCNTIIIADLDGAWLQSDSSSS